MYDFDHEAFDVGTGPWGWVFFCTLIVMLFLSLWKVYDIAMWVLS